MKSVLLATLFFLIFCIDIIAQDSTKTVQFLPDLDGIIKTKSEYDIENNKMRFEVRNARFGAKGKVNELFGYRLEVDLSDEGKIKMMDAYCKITPINKLDVYLGQRKVPFGTDYLRNPAENFFANRSFVSKYTNNGLRDNGIVLSYAFKYFIPIEIWGAAMNGSGVNNPQWIGKPIYSGRILLGKEEGVRMACNYLSGNVQNEIDNQMIGGELRYATKKFLIESEFLNRSNHLTHGVIVLPWIAAIRAKLAERPIHY